MNWMDPPGGKPWALFGLCGASALLNVVLLTSVFTGDEASTAELMNRASICDTCNGGDEYGCCCGSCNTDQRGGSASKRCNRHRRDSTCTECGCSGETTGTRISGCCHAFWYASSVGYVVALLSSYI